MDIIAVGIDVSKDRLDVAVHPGGEAFAMQRNGTGLERLAVRLTQLAPAIVALEATGGFETIAAAALGGAGLPVVVVNPAQVRAFAKALGQRAKTDPIDAAVIAHFAAATRPEPRPLPDEATRLLSDLVARRRQIVEMIGAERQREKRAISRHLKKSITRLVKALEKELVSVDTDIDDAMRGSSAWRETEDLLASVPGVGASRLRPWPDWRPTHASPASGVDAASSVADARWSVPSCSWEPWPRDVTILSSKPSSSALSLPENPKWPPSSPWAVSS
jgi:transposase